MNEYGSDTSIPEEPPAAPVSDTPVETPAAPIAETPVEATAGSLSETSGETSVPSDSTIKEAVSQTSEGSILAKGASSEGLNSEVITNAAADKIKEEISASHGEAVAELIAAPGSIGTGSLEMAQGDIANARRAAEGSAAISEAQNSAGEAGAVEQWPAAAQEVTARESGPESGMSETGDASGSPPSGAPAESVTTPYPENHPMASLWNNIDTPEMGGYQAQAPDYSALEESQQVAADAPVQATPEPAVAAEPMQTQFAAAAPEVTAPAPEAPSAMPPSEEDVGEDGPTRDMKNSRLMHEIRPGGPGEGGTRVYNSRR